MVVVVDEVVVVEDVTMNNKVILQAFHDGPCELVPDVVDKKLSHKFFQKFVAC